jgi:predicted phosphodiesterase
MNSKRDRMVQIISDVHLDVRGHTKTMVPHASTLAVAGDVSSHTDVRYRDYMAELFRNHRYGVYVPGNHEFWGSEYPMPQSLDFMESICRSLPTPVTLLRRGNYGFDVPGTNTRILGATLWTPVPLEVSNTADRILNDYKYIKNGPGHPMTVKNVISWHGSDKEWISDAIKAANSDGKRSVVMTHHAPDVLLSVFNDHKARDGMGVFYYGNDMSSITHMSGISAWLYGHTHESRVFNIPGIRYPFVTNALGYPGESTGYAEGACIEIS